MRVQLDGGAYSARSIIAACQRCVNLYPEKNPQGAPAPYTYYPTPGLVKIAQGPVAPVRGLFKSSSDIPYVVIGSGVYYLGAAPGYALTLLGSLDGTLTGTNPVSFVDNGIQGVIVDGSSKGYLIDVQANTWLGELVDGTGLFTGGTSCVNQDSFVAFSQPGSVTQRRQFYSTLSNTFTFDGTYYATKSNKSDPIVAIVTKQREMWLIGELTTEIWYTSGASGFPFASMPGVQVDLGCAARFSIARDSMAIFWLGVNANGDRLAVRATDYAPTRISNVALEQEWQTYGDISDAVGWAYQEGGHTFYVLTFPSAGKTWAFDVTEGLWHERVASDGGRYRGNCHVFTGEHLVGDYANGAVYRQTTGLYTEDGAAVQRIRTFPHLGNEGKRVTYGSFLADMEAGTTDGATAQLRWSDDRGRTWGNPIAMPLGDAGQGLTAPTWRRLGMARDRVFELSWSVNGPTALNGAYVDQLQGAAT